MINRPTLMEWALLQIDTKFAILITTSYDYNTFIDFPVRYRFKKHLHQLKVEKKYLQQTSIDINQCRKFEMMRIIIIE